MTTLLLVFQLIGVLLAAGAAVASLLKSKGIQEIEIPSLIIGGEKRITRRLSREAKLGVFCIIMGLLVAFAARMLEQHTANTRNLQNQENTSTQLKQAEQQIALTRQSLAEVQLQAKQTQLLLTNVQQQATLMAQALDELFFQSRQTGTILTNVLAQSAVARESLQELSTQSLHTHTILSELEHQGSISDQMLKTEQQQVGAANLSLRFIERALTPLDSVRVVVVYELSAKTQWAAMLISNVVADRTPPRGSTVHASSNQIEVKLDSSALAVLTNDVTVNPVGFGQVYTNNDVVGYASFTNDFTHESGLQVYSWNLEKGIRAGATAYSYGESENFLQVDPLELTANSWRVVIAKYGRATWLDWKRRAAIFANPGLRLEFTSKEKRPGSRTPGLIIDGQPDGATALYYLPDTACLLFQCEFTSPSEKWGRSQSIQSIPDLAEATLAVFSRLASEPGSTNVISLRRALLKFRASTIDLTDWHAIQKGGEIGFETKLPLRGSIISGEDLRE